MMIIIRQLLANTRFRYHKQSGVERYSTEMLQALGDQIKEIKPNRPLVGFAAHIWEQAILPMQIPQNRVLWSPANSGPTLVRKQIITVHDVSPVEHPEWFKSCYAVWYQRMWSYLLPRVIAIFTPSKFSRRRILEHFPLFSEKIWVIPGGVGFHFLPRSQQEIAEMRWKYALPENFILYVGTLEPRKNLSRLITAWQVVKHRHQQMGLVIVGQSGNIFADIGLNHFPQGVNYLGYIDDNDLPAIYSMAKLFVLPSLYEGFGLTVLEAMASGTPVAYARTGALPEIAGDAGINFDPYDPRSIANAMDAVISNSELAAQLTASGKKRANEYSWGRAAQKFSLALEEIDGN